MEPVELKVEDDDYNLSWLDKLVILSLGILIGGIIISATNHYDTKPVANLSLHTSSNGIISIPITAKMLPAISNRHTYIIGITIDTIKN